MAGSGEVRVDGKAFAAGEYRVRLTDAGVAVDVRVDLGGREWTSFHLRRPGRYTVTPQAAGVRVDSAKE